MGKASLRGPVHGGGGQHARFPRALAQPRRALLQGLRRCLDLLRAPQLQGAPILAGEGRVPAVLRVGGHAAHRWIHPPGFRELAASFLESVC